MQKDILERVIGIVLRFLKILSNHIEIQEAYVFGSYVKGTWLRDSDIDLIIVSKDFENLKFIERLDLIYRLQWKHRIKPFIEAIPLTPEEFKVKKNKSAVLRDAKKYWIKIL